MDNQKEFMRCLKSGDAIGAAKLLGKVDPNKLDSLGVTPILYAIYANMLGLIRVMFEGKMINVNGIQGRGGNTSLVIASLLGNVEVVKILLGCGADPNQANLEERTPLLISTDLEVSKLLLAAGANPTAKNIQGRNALNHACDMQLPMNEMQIGIIDLLTQAGVDINEQDNLGRTPLIYTVISGKLNFTRKLIRMGANLDLQDNIDGSTALFYSIRRRSVEMLELLLLGGCSIATKLHDGTGLIEYINQERRKDDSQQLEEIGSLVNAYMTKQNATLVQSNIKNSGIIAEVQLK